MMLAGALVAVGAWMARCGLMVMGMGRTLEGGIFTVMGIMTAVAGYKAYGDASTTSAETEAGKKLASETAGMLAGQAVAKSAVQSGLLAGGTGAVTGGTGAIYGNNIDSRTLNPETQEWD